MAGRTYLSSQSCFILSFHRMGWVRILVFFTSLIYYWFYFSRSFITNLHHLTYSVHVLLVSMRFQPYFRLYMLWLCQHLHIHSIFFSNCIFFGPPSVSQHRSCPYTYRQTPCGLLLLLPYLNMNVYICLLVSHYSVMCHK